MHVLVWIHMGQGMKSLVADCGLFRLVLGKLGWLPDIMKIGRLVGNDRFWNKGNHHLAGFFFMYLVRHGGRNTAAGAETERSAGIVAVISVAIVRSFRLHIVNCRYASRTKIINTWLHHQVKDVNGENERKPFHAPNI